MIVLSTLIQLKVSRFGAAHGFPLPGACCSVCCNVHKGQKKQDMLFPATLKIDLGVSE